MYENFKSYSRIIAGTMTWGQWGKKLSLNEMIERLHYAVQLGVTTFDHADIYGGYSTEAEFGKALKSSKIDRNVIQLITKCGIQMIDDARSSSVKHYDYSEEHIIWSAEQSLKNLNTDFIDLFLLHRPSPLMNPEVIANAITKLLDQGKIKAFGVSNFSPTQIAFLETKIPVSGNQVEFSLTANKAMYDNSIIDCITHGRLAMSWSPLGSYFNDDSEQTRRLRKVVEPLCSKYGVSEDQVLLAWLLKHPANVHLVVGTTSKERLKSSIDSLQVQLELQDWFKLLEASKGNEVA